MHPCYGPPRASSPEPKSALLTARPVRTGIGLVVVAGLLGSVCAIVACSRDARAVRLPTLDPKDEVYRLTCSANIQTCREKADEVCAGVYEVLESSGAPVAPPRVTSEPGPRSTGPRYQRTGWQGQLVIACGKREPMASANVSAVEQAENTPREPQLSVDQLCVPGVTQLCLGPGACRGAQACLTDGRGYGPCDCGNARPPDAGAQNGAAGSASM